MGIFAMQLENLFLQVMLTATSQNLFDENWTEGNLYRISNITNKLGPACCWLISLVGFGIVIFSIMKNAVSGLYVVNPNFWDKVSELKEQVVSTAEAGVNGMVAMVPGKGNAAAQKLGGLFTYFLKAVPNVKALTDFDGQDGVIDKKQYFARSIPLLVAQIFIGMLIFFGYPSKIANWVGTAGTQVLDMALNNIDPVATVTGLSSNFVNADFTYESSNDIYEHNVYLASKEAWTAIVGRASSMKKDPRQQLAYAIENDVYTAFLSYASTIGAEDGYNVSASASYLTTTPSVPSSYKLGNNNVYTSTAANGTITYRWWTQVTNYDTGEREGGIGENDHVIVTFTCTPKSLTSTSSITAIANFTRTDTTQRTSKGYRVNLSGLSYSQQAQDGFVSGTPVVVTVIGFDKKDGNVSTQTNASLEIAGSTFYLDFTADSDTMTKLIQCGFWECTFGASSSNLKYSASNGTLSKDVKISSIWVNGGTGAKSGIVLSNNIAADPYTSPSDVYNNLKAKESPETPDTKETE